MRGNFKTKMIYVDVAINLPVKNLFKQFTYILPDNLNFLDVGWRCVVPFGNQTVEGFIVRRATSLAVDENKVKKVIAALGKESWFDQEMLETAKWIADYYMCSLAESMRLFVPGKTSIKRHAVHDEKGRLVYYEYEERLKEKTVLAYKITDLGRKILTSGNNRAKVQIEALKFLNTKNDVVTGIELGEKGFSSAILKVLVQKGQAEVSTKRVLRDSYAVKSGHDTELVLTDEQNMVVTELTDALNRNNYQTFLLRGVTGSGKTEVYLRATEYALLQGKQVLVLVPEIALTAQLVERFKARFGQNIAVAHSKLSRNERADVWYRTRTGDANILIGVRSAVFAPFNNLGLVIIDEEQEGSYKQEERPNYHARTVAEERCRYCDAVLLLGSATPSLESYYNAQEGKYKEMVLTKRPLGQPLPEVDVVDMRQELAEKNYSVLSKKLQGALAGLSAGDDQAIVLLNRRGYATFVLCRDCGYTVKCDHCDVAMVYHQWDNIMRCHYCGKTLPIPEECPKCHSGRIKFFGTGTQKAEEELAVIQGVKTLRMDQDSTRQKFAHEEILNQFKTGNYNVLIGTQMVAKGHDIPNVTLVGVLSADTSLNLPDFRAGERTFALLTQAAGRAGRGDRPGKVIFQTYDADSEVLKMAMLQDYSAFAKRELQNRKEYMYPPYCQILKITILDKSEDSALNLAQRIGLFLQENSEQSKCSVLGPFPALVSKVRDYFRFNLLVKAENLTEVKKKLMASEFKDIRNIYFDVDPTNVV